MNNNDKINISTIDNIWKDILSLIKNNTKTSILLWILWVGVIDNLTHSVRNNLLHILWSNGLIYLCHENDVINNNDIESLIINGGFEDTYVLNNFSITESIINNV